MASFIRMEHFVRFSLSHRSRAILFLSLCIVTYLLLFVIYKPLIGFSKPKIINLTHSSNESRFLNGVSSEDLAKYKTILIWNKPDRVEGGAEFGYGHQPFVEHQCEVNQCAFYDRETSPLPLEDYDAIIVNMVLLKPDELPDFKRKHQQRVIFLSQESPSTLPSFITPNLRNYFNWTMTYRHNSDIQLLYGRLLTGSTAPTTPEETQQLIRQTHLTHLGSSNNYAINKTRPVGWMVSHCQTDGQRESYVRELSKHIPIDVYGRCGNLSCSRNEKDWRSYPKCYDMLEANYKFYLSFENSVCTDYVTEKFFEIISRDIVPVVYGGADYSRIAPPHSYINALDYTPEKLAEYLKLLDSNDTLYNEYFWWKDHYRYEYELEETVRDGFCNLCKKLHYDEGKTKYYPELLSEWHPNMQCRLFTSWETGSDLNPFVKWFSWLG